jgi:hypothetical protein
VTQAPTYGDPRPAGGPTLGAAVAARGPLPVRSVLSLAVGLAEALSAAHAADVIHPGLNPAGILLTPDGPRLTRAGIPQAAYRGQAGPAGLPPGVPDFTPPERAAGLEAGPASDMFSLGVVLLYAATGAWMSYFAWHLDQLPRELQPFIERCLAADPARRPTAAGLRAELTAAYPEAVHHAAWLPPWILAQGTPPPPGWPAQGPAPAPTAPPKPRKPRNTGKIRRRAGIIATAALAFAVAAAGTVYVIHPWPYPVLQPMGLVLVTEQRAATSISIGWSNTGSGPLPDKYVILRDGTVAATVPGNVNHFTEEGLAPGTKYDFRVIAYRGQAHSVSSQDLSVATPAPSLPEAVFNSVFTVTETIETGGDSVNGGTNGTTSQDDWDFSSNCAMGPCEAGVNGSLGDSIPFFTVVLKPSGGGSYTGTVNDYQACGDTESDTTLTITIKPSSADMVIGQLQVESFTGSLTWDIAANPSGGCASSKLVVKLAGNSHT